VHGIAGPPRDRADAVGPSGLAPPGTGRLRSGAATQARADSRAHATFRRASARLSAACGPSEPGYRMALSGTVSRLDPRRRPCYEQAGVSSVDLVAERIPFAPRCSGRGARVAFPYRGMA
jgi:hypothetical protein